MITKTEFHHLPLWKDIVEQTPLPNNPERPYTEIMGKITAAGGLSLQIGRIVNNRGVKEEKQDHRIPFYHLKD